MNTFRFEFEDRVSSIKAIVASEKLDNNNWAIKYNKPIHLFPIEVWKDLFQSAFNQLSQLNIGNIVTRVRTDYEHKKITSILTEFSFKLEGTREEFQGIVNTLPNDENTPFLWVSYEKLNWSKTDLISFVKKVTKNTEFLKNETAASFISDWFKHEELSHGPECIHVGFLNNVALNH